MNNDEHRGNNIPAQEGKICIGAQLKTIRENIGLSAQEAAARLRLSPRFISMLEEEDLLTSTLPPIYLRGYLRSYARLLNITEADIDSALAKLAPTPVVIAPTAISPESLSLSFPLEKNSFYARLATFLISLVLITAVTAWWYLHTSTPSTIVLATHEPTIREQPIEPPSIETPRIESTTIPATKAQNVALASNIPVTPSTSTPQKSSAQQVIRQMAAGEQEGDKENVANEDEQE